MHKNMERSISNHKQYLSLKIRLQGTFNFFLALIIFYLQGVIVIIFKKFNYFKFNYYELS